MSLFPLWTDARIVSLVGSTETVAMGLYQIHEPDSSIKWDELYPSVRRVWRSKARRLILEGLREEEVVG